jgi:hypothetical protein
MDDNFDNWSDCFHCGMWIPGLPFISCCVNPYCCIVTFIEDGDLDEGSYCPRDLGVCNNKLRDEYFYHRHKVSVAIYIILTFVQMIVSISPDLITYHLTSSGRRTRTTIRNRCLMRKDMTGELRSSLLLSLRA